ncbi:HIT domain-containing protein [Candidatus Microgenomates bacterium]|nr:HIT domain-containing protein [Candidatus Microgenomates bacterium]
MSDCVFCKIAAGEDSRDLVYRDELIAVFPSIDPQAPVHLLLVPRKHVENLEDLADELVVAIKNKALDIVKERNLSPKGYRLSTNGGAAKAVSHVHFHLLGEVAVERKV